MDRERIFEEQKDRIGSIRDGVIFDELSKNEQVGYVSIAEVDEMILDMKEASEGSDNVEDINALRDMRSILSEAVLLAGDKGIDIYLQQKAHELESAGDDSGAGAANDAVSLYIRQKVRLRKLPEYEAFFKYRELVQKNHKRS